MTITAYLAGPDVFLPNAVEHAKRKVEICNDYGINGIAPLNQDMDVEYTGKSDWIGIYVKDVKMMERSDIIIANLTPFRGVSADSGTLIEVGWFSGRKRPVFAYSNEAILFSERSMAYLERNPDPMEGVSVEGFSLPDNLMIPGSVLFGGGGAVELPRNESLPFDSLEVFERCVKNVASRLMVR